MHIAVHCRPWQPLCHVMACHVIRWHGVPRHGMACHGMPYRVRSWHDTSWVHRDHCGPLPFVPIHRCVFPPMPSELPSIAIQCRPWPSIPIGIAVCCFPLPTAIDSNGRQGRIESDDEGLHMYSHIYKEREREIYVYI